MFDATLLDDDSMYVIELRAVIHRRRRDVRTGTGWKCNAVSFCGPGGNYGPGLPSPLFFV